MSEPPSDPGAGPEPTTVSTSTLFSVIAFVFLAGILAILGDVGLASLSALLGVGVLLLALANDHRPHFARLGVACTALGGVASFVHVLLRVIGP
ncbi:hypothetical protein CRI94_14910 [Longibacter salinarum]|uniref:Uncharacterized protein n=1 Tax=Longibacter salinarum TaxID=1850348 RepID=A0A2A8CV34_9BACT|nr:hypothetical protein [Longibacter salinarum]PEN12311.1 hypothetical protein CRI94_14910 [Longibacter salinarum]